MTEMRRPADFMIERGGISDVRSTGGLEGSGP